MSTDRKKHEKALELDKILLALSEEASFERSKQLCLETEPSYSLAQAKESLSKTLDAYTLTARFGSPTITGIKDVTTALKRAQTGGVLSLSELLRIAEVLRNIRAVTEWHERCLGVKSSLDGMFLSLYPNRYFEEKLLSAIINDEELADSASDTLCDIRRKIRNAESKVRSLLDSFVHSQKNQKYMQDAIITMREGRFVVPVKSEYRGEVSGLVHDTSASGATMFIEPMSVVAANNEIKVLKSREHDEIERIIAEFSAETGSFSESILVSYESLARIDVAFAKAKLAYKMNASAPILNIENRTMLRGARHPLIDKKCVVPIDISLGDGYSSLVITGPNTGGKTVTLKTVGLLTLMAMCGLMIPALDQSEICVYSNIFVDIGDEQSIEQNLSTFSSHMVNIIDIIEHSGNNTLVLIDELGAGTDPVEGAALAVSILESLKECGASLLATTHYAEMKIYALNTPGVENACCEFDVATLRPTYRLLIGVPGRSNAFAISSRLGMPESIIEHAKTLVSGEDQRFEDTVERLERKRQEFESETEKLREQTQQLEKRNEQLKKRIDDGEAERERIISEARQEATALVSGVRRDSERLISELEDLRREKESADFAKKTADAKKQLRGKILALENKADPVTIIQHDDSYKLPRVLRAGDTVFVRSLGKEGSVIEPCDKNKTVLLRIGIIKSRVSESDLRLVDKKPENKKKSIRTGVESRATAKVSTELDIRGMNIEEAMPVLDRFIDDAVLSNLNIIRIIHGKGTGVLGQAVQSHLKKHKSIKFCRYGIYGEGENGVTIAEMK